MNLSHQYTLHTCSLVKDLPDSSKIWEERAGFVILCVTAAQPHLYQDTWICLHRTSSGMKQQAVAGAGWEPMCICGGGVQARRLLPHRQPAAVLHKPGTHTHMRMHMYTHACAQSHTHTHTHSHTHGNTPLKS